MEDQDRFERLEQRLDAAGRRIEELADKISQRVETRINDGVNRAEAKLKNDDDEDASDLGNYGRVFWGLAFVVAGSIWLGNQMGWFDLDIPLGAAAIILIGLYLIVSHRRR